MTFLPVFLFQWPAFGYLLPPFVQVKLKEERPMWHSNVCDGMGEPELVYQIFSKPHRVGVQSNDKVLASILVKVGIKINGAS
ncbi:MAG TPA: hypothetical protein DDY13_10540 [Cytophagales bacterium]|jgi:hypothetical protein|nr:hypothetical protein [Cytophagales bacterium]